MRLRSLASLVTFASLGGCALFVKFGDYTDEGTGGHGGLGGQSATSSSSGSGPSSSGASTSSGTTSSSGATSSSSGVTTSSGGGTGGAASSSSSATSASSTSTTSSTSTASSTSTTSSTSSTSAASSSGLPCGGLCGACRFCDMSNMTCASQAPMFDDPLCELQTSGPACGGGACLCDGAGNCLLKSGQLCNIDQDCLSGSCSMANLHCL